MASYPHICKLHGTAQCAQTAQCMQTAQIDYYEQLSSVHAHFAAHCSFKHATADPPKTIWETAGSCEVPKISLEIKVLVELGPWRQVTY